MNIWLDSLHNAGSLWGMVLYVLIFLSVLIGFYISLFDGAPGRLTKGTMLFALVASIGALAWQCLHLKG